MEPPRQRRAAIALAGVAYPDRGRSSVRREDRKSTRLNSSHTVISYAVFCLKKKNNIMFAVGKSIRLEGFNISPRLDLMPELRKQMSAWIHEGKVMWKVTVAYGVENCPIDVI